MKKYTLLATLCYIAAVGLDIAALIGFLSPDSSSIGSTCLSFGSVCLCLGVLFSGKQRSIDDTEKK